MSAIKGLKICFIAGTLGMGGAERQLYSILKALKEHGADVSLISLTSGEHWEQPIKALGVNYYTLNGEGSKITRVLKITSILRRLKPAIVQSQHFYTNMYAAAAGRLAGAISIGASRSELAVEIRLNGRFGKISFTMPDFIFANSNLTIEQGLAYRNRDTMYYLPNALDLEKFSAAADTLQKDNNALTLLTIGRMTSEKRFEMFIELMARLRVRYGNAVNGILIGDGKMAEELRQKAKALDLGAEVLEFIPHTSVPEKYMQQADMYILTSSYEGTPNVVLESMACGLPVITTKVGNLPYFINDGENGLIFDGSIAQLEEKAAKLIQDNEMRNRLGINGRKTIEDQFSFKALEANLEKLYPNILKKKGKLK